MDAIVGVSACLKAIEGEPHHVAGARYGEALIGGAGAIPMLLPPLGAGMLGVLDRLDRESEHAECEIEADLARLTSANMRDYVMRFVAALDAGAIEPMDFVT